MSENPYYNQPYGTEGGPETENPYTQKSSGGQGDSDGASPYGYSASNVGGVPLRNQVAGGAAAFPFEDPYQPPGHRQGQTAVTRASLVAGKATSLSPGSLGSSGGITSAMSEAAGATRYVVAVGLALAALLVLSKAGFLVLILAAALYGVSISRSRYLAAWAATAVNTLAIYMALALAARVIFWLIDAVSDFLLVDFSLYWLRIVCALIFVGFAVLAAMGRGVRLPRRLRFLGE